MRFAASLTLLALLSASPLAADTIVLKNGRKIQAANVVQSADRVTYQTPAGEMSIPKSIVERVDRDDLAYASAPKSDSIPPVSAPQFEPIPGSEDVTAQTVHDNSIDHAYIARLESDARLGTHPAIDKVAAAHHAAAQYLLTQGDTDDAIDQYRQALIFAPNNVGVLLNLAVLYLRESQFTMALDPLEHARRVTPESVPANAHIAADIAKLMGWAYYGANKMNLAIEEWKHAERIRQDPEVEQALAKTQRDKDEEESYREGETAHFDLKYNGSATPELASRILRVLEDDFRDLESQFNFTPPESIAVILYTSQAFADITRAPSWAGALNDGRLRIPVQGLNDVSPDLARVLKHELTHSFVGQKSHGRAPTWLQEGLAQYMEGRRSSGTAGPLLDASKHGQSLSLEDLEGSWLGLSGNTAAFAYAWSLAAVESIIQSGGMEDISRLLDRLTTSTSVETALRESLHSSYSDLTQQTLGYLQHEYVR